jgi:hypothetical protein
MAADAIEGGVSLPLSLVLVFTLSASPGGPAIRLELEAGLACDLNTSLPPSLARQDVKVTAEDTEANWVLSARRDGEAVQLRLLTPQSVLVSSRRFNPVTSDCPVLSHAVALLVKSWVQAHAATAPPPVVGPKKKEPAIVEPTPALARRPTPPSVDETPPPAALPPEPKAIEPDLLNEPQPAPVAVSASQELSRSLPRQLVPHPTRTLSVMLAGGGAIATGDAAVGTARLAVELGFAEPWAVAIDAGFQSLRGASTANGGSVRASLQWATLSARRAFFSRGVRGLQLSLGAQLVRLEAAARGFTQSSRASVFTPGAAVSAEWRQPLAAGLFVLGRLGFQARWPQTFSINGLASPVLSVPAWGFGLEAGVGWNFF